MARDMSEIFEIFEQIFDATIRMSLAPNEKYDDVRRMIELLTHARAERMDSRSIEHCIYSGSVICAIFEPLKLPDFAGSARAFRLRFRGIAKDPELVKEFRAAWSRRLLETPDLESALDAGFDALFHVERGMSLA
jgi:hypothetical protein